MATIMATGYVHGMIDENMNFPEFALRCCRGMGATILMRDDPLSTPIPEKFEPHVSYHNEAIAKAETALADFAKMDDAAKLAFGEAEKVRQIDQYIKYQADRTSDVAKVKAMLLRVEEWKPPTSEHEGLKRFMREQLSQSIQHEMSDYYGEQIAVWRAKDAMQVVVDMESKARRDIEYHRKEIAAEIERTDGRNEWMRQVRESLMVE